MSFAYFHREFLGKEDNPDQDSYIIARVPKVNEYGTGGTLTICDGYDKLHLTFLVTKEKTSDPQEIIRQVKVLASVINQFAISLEEQVNLIPKEEEESTITSTSDKPPFPSI